MLPVINGMKRKHHNSAKSSSEYFMSAFLRSPGIRSFILKYTASFVVVYFGDFHTPSTICMIDGNEIIVFGLFHCARDPRTIGAKLEDRIDPT